MIMPFIMWTILKVHLSILFSSFKMRPLWQEVQTVGEKEHVAHGDWQAGQDGAVWAYQELHLKRKIFIWIK